jgi:ABC-type nitrate/sulfonate/bicarbonate transport system substrate-binding protein
MAVSRDPCVPNALSRRAVLALMGVASAGALRPRAAAAAESATLAWTPGPSTPQIALALQRGLWDQAGLTVRPVSFPTGREALEALLGGGADFASLAEFPVVTAALRAQKFAVLASLSVFVGHRIIINAASGAKDIAGLAGHKVGVTLGTNMQFLASRVLKSVKVEYVNVAPGDMVPALARRDIDAAFMFDSFYPQAKAVLAANYIEIMTPDYQGQFLVAAGRAILDSRPAAVGSFLAALLKADEMTADSAAAAAAISAATGGTLAVQAIAAQWSNYRFEVNINGNLLPLLMDQGAWINTTGLITTPATRDLMRGYIADSHLAKLAPKRVAL